MHLIHGIHELFISSKRVVHLGLRKAFPSSQQERIYHDVSYGWVEAGTWFVCEYKPDVSRDRMQLTRRYCVPSRRGNTVDVLLADWEMLCDWGWFRR